MELNRTPTDLYAGYLVDDSDLEYSDCSAEGSSDDEECPVQYNSYKTLEQQEGSSEDEFEREMAGEVMSAMKLMVSSAAAASQAVAKEGKRKKAESSRQKSTTNSQTASTSQDQSSSNYYDEVYFDSDASSSEEDQREGEGERGGARKGAEGAAKKVKKLTNDELFYDPDMDAEDEKWVNRQRMAYHNVKVSEHLVKKKQARQASDPSRSSGRASSSGSVPKSDAILNCPACMSTVCLDCQRHDTYANQYRAMFVLNCQVMRDEVLKYVPKPSKKARKRARAKGKASSEGGQGSDFKGEEQQGGVSSSLVVGESPSQDEATDRYHPVRCTNCNTEIAVMDSDEVFHFFNVLPSAPS